jgi:hypothetical protein
MQPVSYSSCSLAFIHPSYITLVVQEEPDIAQLASPLVYFFISPENFAPRELFETKTNDTQMNGLCIHILYINISIIVLVQKRSEMQASVSRRVYSLKKKAKQAKSENGRSVLVSFQMVI